MAARSSKTPDVSGILVIDKPQGVTSHDVVAAVRGALHMRRVGHAGTLDPMATGVLVVGFGYATRLLNYIVGADKTYEATIRLGQRTTTDDADGDILPWGSDVSQSVATADDAATVSVDESTEIDDEPADDEPTQDEVTARLHALTRETVERTIAEHFLGRIEQVPSTFSAIKIHGQRAYDLAREGKDVELEARPITIHDFTILDYDVTASNSSVLPPRDGAVTPTGVTEGGLAPFTERNTPHLDLTVRVTCSSGTYIRALARDLGRALGVGGHLTRLRRTRVGSFDVTATTVVTAHTENRTFTNRDGETITRAKAILDVPETAVSGETGDVDRRTALLTRMIDMPAAARLTMPCLDITGEEARELRFGRRIGHTVKEPTAAIAGDDLAAIVERANSHQSKPTVVFPAASAGE
ncbi:tRNA pseudouridine synthase B [Bifidobacterium callimiconis]|uniref:tRNA pseudouridine synthase B n=1 Tax=Bifidobacterium callimiconis TaxID=2306973 RepID=UPI001F49D41D|nr:tRNA pseudouridine(55) synthase TruB [Bifidobacterium callimiconis]